MDQRQPEFMHTLGNKGERDWPMMLDDPHQHNGYSNRPWELAFNVTKNQALSTTMCHRSHSPFNLLYRASSAHLVRPTLLKPSCYNLCMLSRGIVSARASHFGRATEWIHQLAGQTLDQILAFAKSTMMIKMPRYDDQRRGLDAMTTGAWFVTEVLRTASYKKAQWHLRSAGKISGREKKFCMLRALQCVGYAVAVPLADGITNAPWKVRCYLMVVHLYMFFGEMEPAMLYVERCAVMLSITTMEDFQS